MCRSIALFGRPCLTNDRRVIRTKWHFSFKTNPLLIVFIEKRMFIPRKLCTTIVNFASCRYNLISFGVNGKAAIVLFKCYHWTVVAVVSKQTILRAVSFLDSVEILENYFPPSSLKMHQIRFFSRLSAFCTRIQIMPHVLESVPKVMAAHAIGQKYILSYLCFRILFTRLMNRLYQYRVHLTWFSLVLKSVWKKFFMFAWNV